MDDGENSAATSFGGVASFMSDVDLMSEDKRQQLREIEVELYF